jgi:hypothetical protein
LRVGCARACKVLISATLSTSRPRRTVRLLSVSGPLAPAHAGLLRVRVSHAALRALQRALGRRHGMLARVSIVAAGPTGLRTTVYRTFAVTR